MQVLIPIIKQMQPKLGVRDKIGNDKELNHLLVLLVPVLEEVLWEWARVALVNNSVKILQAVPKCHPTTSVNLHLKVQITSALKVVSTRTDTSMRCQLKHKVIT